MALEGADSRLLGVRVLDERTRHECFFHSLHRATARTVREHAAVLLGRTDKDTVLADTGGCIIDDLCTMADLDTYQLVLLD